MAPLLQILQMKSLDVLFHYEKLNNIILNHWLEGLRILNMEYVNSQEWRAKCQHQKSYQKTNKHSWIISLQSWKKRYHYLSMFLDFLSSCHAFKCRNPKNPVQKSTLNFSVFLYTNNLWLLELEFFFFTLDETINNSSIISLPNSKPIKGNLRNIDGAKRQNKPT